MNLRTSAWLVSPALIVFCALASAQDEPKKKPAPPRFGFNLDLDVYPQATPEKAMQSIVKALDRERVDYLLAHMADPNYVDYWVDRYKADFTKGKEEAKRLLAFDRLVRETKLYYQNDPLILKDMRIFARDAKWAEDGDQAVGAVESIPFRKVFMRKIGDRWLLENKQQ